MPQTRRLILQKARSHDTPRQDSTATLPRLVGTRFQVLFHSAPAVLFTIPSRYYPLSVTREYLGLTGGPARFTQDFSGPMLLGCPQTSCRHFSYGGLTLYAGPFACPSPTPYNFSLDRPAGRPIKRTPTTPHAQPLPGLTHIRFSLIRFRSPLLPESRLFSLPAGTEMFHFPAFPPHTLYIQVRVTAHDDCRVSPFGHPRITARLTAPRGLSRPPTSFIGSWCQGIHRAPLKTWPQMLASTVQFSNNNQPPATPTPRRSLHRDRHRRASKHTRPVPSDTQQRARHPQPPRAAFHAPEGQYCRPARPGPCRIVNVPPMSNHRRTCADEMALDRP